MAAISGPDEYIKLFYYHNYGSFQFSKEFMKYVNDVCRGANVELIFIDEYNTRPVTVDSRINKTLIDCIELWKQHAFSRGSYKGIEIVKIAERYRNYIVLEDYDGSESVGIHYEKYKLDKIHEIMKLSLTDADKLKRIGMVFDEPELEIIYSNEAERHIAYDEVHDGEVFGIDEEQEGVVN